jgi:hypothetical protein
MTSENKITKNAMTLLSSVAGCSVVAVLLIAVVIVAPIANLPAAGQQLQSNQAQDSRGQQVEPSTTTNTTTNVTTSTTSSGSVLRLSNANVEIDVPLMKGYENGNEIFFIATDASDNQTAAQITNETGFKVNFAPLLAMTPEEARGQAYVFENGIEGEGPLGFQLPVINARPRQEGYSPLLQINLVRWSEAAQPAELKSEEDIIAASNAGQLTINKTDVIVDHPAVQWQGGSLSIREDVLNISDESPYMGGQVTNINTVNMTATFVAHRGWGPDGKTVYYIVTDAVPEMPASMMGVPFVAADEKVIGTPVAPDLFQFTNGINGTGPMGFQSGIGSANSDDPEKYSPMWKIGFIEWKDPSQARVLENQNDINMMLQKGLITLMPAMEGRHIVNCPFFDVETIFEHQKGSS